MDGRDNGPAMTIFGRPAGVAAKGGVYLLHLPAHRQWAHAIALGCPAARAYASEGWHSNRNSFVVLRRAAVTSRPRCHGSNLLNWIFWAAPLLVAISGLALLSSGVGHLLRGRAVRASGHLVFGAPLAVIGFVAGLLGLNAQTYARLTHEGPVAQVSVRSLDPASARFLVTMRRLDGTGRTQTCELQGDEWVLSGRVQKWKPWANLLGLDATYTLEQLSNMYFSAARGNGKPITACDIADVAPRIDQYLPPSWLAWLAARSFAVDRHFGSANYMPLADAAVYRVVITQSGFNAEPVNQPARAANEARR